MFSVDVRRTARARVFALRGKLDHDSAVQVQEAADLVLTGPDQPGLVVVDRTALAFCDSSGIGGLIGIHQKSSAHGGVLRLAAAPGSVARVFSLTGLDHTIAVHPTPESALLSGARPREAGSEAPAPPARRASERSTGR